MQPIPIRRLTPADVEEYRRRMLDAYDRHPDAFTSTAAERAPLPLSWWERRVSPEPDADERVLGAFSEQGLVGVAGLSFEKGTKVRHKAKLFGMYVHESHRGQNLGRRLVEAVLAEARQRPEVRVVQLTVTQGNLAAEGLYRRCGFETFGIEPMAMALGDGFVAKVHMGCVL